MTVKFFKGILIGIISLYVIIFILISIFQEKMIFMPESLPNDYQYQFTSKFEEIYLDNNDGARLNALHFKVENPKGVILYYHGNAGELASWGIVVQKFVDRSYDVLVMDYRGYGKSTGSMIEEGLYSDAQLFYDYLLESYSEDEIVVYGRSLGTTFATYVAAKNHPKKLILEAPFYSMNEVAGSRFPIYPVSWFLKFHFPTNKYILEVACPIVIFHGMDDTMVSYDNSVKLSKLVKPEQLSLISISGGNHNDLVSTLEYKEGLDDIL